MPYRLIAALFALHATAALADPLAGTIDDPNLRKKVDVVYVEKAEGAFPPPATPVAIDQKGFKFLPHLSVFVVGTKAAFHSQDPELHNVYARLGKGVLFNDAVLPQGHFDRVFGKAGVVHLTCNIHKDMSAWIVVLQNPFFSTAIDRGTGAFTIANVPPGSYTIRVWGEGLSDGENGKTWPVTVGPGAAPLKVR